jgi:hypothetical protein
MPTQTTLEPIPKTFYRDKTIGGLFYFLGKNGRDYVFDASLGQRVMSRVAFENHLVEVLDTEAYLQKNPSERALVQRHMPSPDSCTDLRPVLTVKIKTVSSVGEPSSQPDISLDEMGRRCRAMLEQESGGIY